MIGHTRRKLTSLISVSALVFGAFVALGSSPASALPTQITVTSNADAGPFTLRQAFIDAQAGSVDFEITIPASVGNITLTSASLTYAGGSGGTHTLTLLGGGNTITQTAADRVINVPGGGVFTMDHLTITGGVAPAGQVGGGIRSAGGSSVVVTNSTITGNSAPDSGGGIHTGGTLTLTNSTISGNHADSAGGAAFAGSGMTVTGSTISGNTASQGGGLHFDGFATFTNSTITGNIATSNAGGVLADSPLTLKYVTIASNTAPGSGANIWFRVADGLTSFGSVVALPLGGGANCLGQSGGTSQGYNWEDSNTCGFGSGTGDHVNAGDPALGALGNNGGPTQTRLPATGSGLVDKIPAASPCGGVNIVVDQRGLPRPTTVGSFCDIGAVELQVVAPAAPVGRQPSFAG